MVAFLLLGIPLCLIFAIIIWMLSAVKISHKLRREDVQQSEPQIEPSLAAYRHINKFGRASVEDIIRILSNTAIMVNAVGNARCSVCPKHLKNEKCQFVDPEIQDIDKLIQEIASVMKQTTECFVMSEKVFLSLPSEGKEHFRKSVQDYLDFAAEANALEKEHLPKLRAIGNSMLLSDQLEDRSRSAKEVFAWINDLLTSMLTHLKESAQHQKIVAEYIFASARQRPGSAPSASIIAAMLDLKPVINQTPISAQFDKFCAEVTMFPANALDEELTVRMQEQYLPLLDKLATCYVEANDVVKSELAPELEKMLNTLREIVEKEKHDPETLKVAALKAEVAATRALAELRGDVNAWVQM